MTATSEQATGRMDAIAELFRQGRRVSEVIAHGLNQANGWRRDAPAVLGISLLALPVVAPATVLVLLTLTVDRAVEATR